MIKRNTNTGAVLEAMMLPALARGGYAYRQQVSTGSRLGSKGRQFVDAIATKDGVDILVSLKWQQTSGTAEQKVPFEVMCLAEVLHELVFHGNYDSMRFLIDRGIDMTIKDYRWNSTAQGWARYAAKDEKMAQWLEDAERQRELRR